MSRIYIDAGHGGSDPGAVGYNIKEKDITLKIAKLVKSYLDNNYTGYAVKMSRTTDTTLSLAQRVIDANNWKADYFLSIHINAGGGTGYEDYIYNGKVSSKTVSNRNTLHKAVVNRMGNVANRGKKKANFYVLRMTSMPSCLTENLFIDTKADAEMLKSDAYLEAVAQGHAEGLAKMFKLKKKSGSKNKTQSSNKDKPVISKPPASKKYVKKMADEVIAGKHGKGHVNRRKSLGVSEIVYQEVRKEVNFRSNSPTPKNTNKTIATMAKEVLAGKHGNGHSTRQKSLGISNATYNKVKAEVNKRAGGGSTSKSNSPNINQLAKKIINSSNAPTGHYARQRWLGVNSVTYEKVRAEVNRLLK